MVTADIAYSEENRKPEGEPMVIDGTHLMARRVNTTVPTTLWADANLVFNFACNDQEGMGFGEGEYCCMESESD